MMPHNRLSARRRRDLVVHLKLMELRMGYRNGLPYEVLGQMIEELGELVEKYNDEDRRYAQDMQIRNRDLMETTV